MPDDDLRLVVARVPEEDRLPLALTCKPLSVLCIAVADHGRKAGAPRWITEATTTLARMRWAVRGIRAPIPPSWCAALAKRGDKRLLSYVLSDEDWRPPDLGQDVCAAAAAGGHVGLLEWLRFEKNAPWDATVVQAAVKGGHLTVLRWLCRHIMNREFGSIVDAQNVIMRTAVQHGHLEIVQWVYGRMDGNHTPAATMDDNYATHVIASAQYGQLAVLQWLVLNIGGWRTWPGPHFLDVWRAAARNSHVATLQWMRSQLGGAYDKVVFFTAVVGGQLAPLQWLHSLGPCPYGDHEPSKPLFCLMAARDGYLDVLEWLRSQGSPWEKGECLIAARRNGHTAVAEWIRAQPCVCRLGWL